MRNGHATDFTGEDLYEQIMRICEERYGPAADRSNWAALGAATREKWREAERGWWTRLALANAGPVAPAIGLLDLRLAVHRGVPPRDGNRP